MIKLRKIIVDTYKGADRLRVWSEELSCPLLTLTPEDCDRPYLCLQKDLSTPFVSTITNSSTGLYVDKKQRGFPVAYVHELQELYLIEHTEDKVEL